MYQAFRAQESTYRRYWLALLPVGRASHRRRAGAAHPHLAAWQQTDPSRALLPELDGLLSVPSIGTSSTATAARRCRVPDVPGSHVRESVQTAMAIANATGPLRRSRRPTVMPTSTRPPSRRSKPPRCGQCAACSSPTSSFFGENVPAARLRRCPRRGRHRVCHPGRRLFVDGFRFRFVQQAHAAGPHRPSSIAAVRAATTGDSKDRGRCGDSVKEAVGVGGARSRAPARAIAQGLRPRLHWTGCLTP